MRGHWVAGWVERDEAIGGCEEEEEAGNRIPGGRD